MSLPTNKTTATNCETYGIYTTTWMPSGQRRRVLTIYYATGKKCHAGKDFQGDQKADKLFFFVFKPGNKTVAQNRH